MAPTGENCRDRQLASLTHAKGATTLNAYTWAYDAMSRPTTQTSNDGTDVFSYDASSQVAGATHTSQSNESHSYDANGNRTVSGYTTGTNNRLTSDGTYNDQYDGEGNRTRRTEIATGKYDALECAGFIPALAFTFQQRHAARRTRPKKAAPPQRKAMKIHRTPRTAAVRVGRRKSGVGRRGVAAPAH